MKTNELIDMLASGAQPVDGGALDRRYIAALGWGMLGTVLLMMFLLGVRKDIAAAALLPMFWAKLTFAGLMLAGAWLALLRLSRPGFGLGRSWCWPAAAVAGMGLLAALSLWDAAPAARERLIYGVSWSVCPLYIAGLSLPAFIAVWWALRDSAPTRPALAGAAAGLTAGGIGAAAYALYCPEMAAPFVGIWYLLGMLIPATLGALLGPLLLKW